MKKILYSIILLFSINISIGQTLSSDRNPKYNSSINPKYNSNINPKYNSRINPKYSSNINPNYSSALNPKYNSSINPRYTSDLNPKYNSSINPKYANGLNPFKGAWTGKYLFDQDANIIAILAKANNNVYLYYDNSGEWIGYFIRAKNNFNLFTLDADWTGKYLCSDSENGFNLFGEDGEWTTTYVK